MNPEKIAPKNQSKSFEGLKREFSENIRPVIEKRDLENLCKGDEMLEELFDKMIEDFKLYTENVAELGEGSTKLGKGEMTMEDFNEIRDRAHRIHDNTIMSLKILVRNLAQKGKDTSWAGSLFSGGENRPAIGRFAILTTLSE